MAGNIIKEYLVGLGFKLDEESWKKFNLGISRAEATAVHLGTSALATASAVAIAVSKIAQQYNDLYYVSQRTNASVGQLRSYEFAGAQIGISYDRARAAVEGFAAATRLNPGLSGLLRGMGVDPGNAATASTAFVGRLKKQFGEGGYFVAARMAEMYGLDESTFRQLWTNFETLKQQQADYDRRLRESGVDTDGLARKSVTFTRALAGLESQIGLIGDQIAAKWLPGMSSGVEWLDKMAQGLAIVGKNTDGWSSSILGVISAIGGMKAAAWFLRLIPGMGGVARVLGAPAAAAGGVVGSTLAVAGGMLLASTEQANKGEKDIYDKRGQLTEHGRQLQATNVKNPRQRAIDYFVSQGWSREAAYGIAANIDKESKFDTSASGDGGKAKGIAQWHPQRQAMFRALYGKDVAGATFDEQLAFINWELNNTEKGAGDRLRKAGTAREAGAVVSSMYERPANTAGEASSRGATAQKWFDAAPLGVGGPAGGANVTISQTNNTTIHGAGDPAATGRAVAEGQERANGDLLRNTKGAVR